jgi:hypothetical protein
MPLPNKKPLRGGSGRPLRRWFGLFPALKGRLKKYLSLPGEAPPFLIRQFLNTLRQFSFHDDGLCHLHIPIYIPIWDICQEDKRKILKKTQIFLLEKGDNDIMSEKVQRAVRFEKWMVNKIEAIAKEKGLTFSDMVNKFLRQELEYQGYTEGKYDAETYGIGREVGEAFSDGNPQKAEKAQ